jgi:hypothetical protein
MSDDTISILAGGWTARGYDRTKLPGLVIGVNEASVLAPCRIALTMDRLWAESRFASLRLHWFHGQLDEFHVRASAAKNLDLVESSEHREWVRVFDNDHTSVDLTDAPGRLNGTNSGVCAINLAYQMRPRRLILFGFDMNRSPAGDAYWHKPYEWAPGGATKDGKYRAWAAEFDLIARLCATAGIEVLNASQSSSIHAFPKVQPEKVLK